MIFCECCVNLLKLFKKKDSLRSKSFQGMKAARDKYGDEVYNKMFLTLMLEFGEEAFQPFITEFRGNGRDTTRDVTFELSSTTEAFCYKYDKLNWATDELLQDFSDEQKQYIQDFADAFRYDFPFTSLP
jgi:hypothetical protein